MSCIFSYFEIYCKFLRFFVVGADSLGAHSYTRSLKKNQYLLKGKLLLIKSTYPICMSFLINCSLKINNQKFHCML